MVLRSSQDQGHVVEPSMAPMLKASTWEGEVHEQGQEAAAPNSNHMAGGGYVNNPGTVGRPT